VALPPLVEPAAELTNDEVRRYSRHLIIPEVGMIGQQRLKNAKVLVIGAGGLGSPALLYLAAAGVGSLGIVDFDEVDESNLQRQVIHGQSDLGVSKARSAAASVAEVNPYVEVVLHEVRLETDNVLEVFADYDLILDGTDNFATRYLVNDAAVLLGKPYVWGSIFRFEGQVSVFWAKHGPQYRDLYPEPPPPGMVPSCAEGGVLGVLCASVGSIMSTEAIKLITGIGDPLVGRLMVYDALEMRYDTLKVSRDPNGDPVTGLLEDYQAFCGVLSDEAADAAAGSTISVTELDGMLKERRDEDWDMGKMWYELTTRRPQEKNIGYCESHDQALVGDKTIMFWLADKEMYWGMNRAYPNPAVERAMALHNMIRLVTCSLAGEGYLNFMGNEFGHPEWIDFPREGNGWSYKYARRQWSLCDNEMLKYAWLRDFDRAMLKFARKYRVLSKRGAVNLWVDQERKLLAFCKGDIIYLFNFHPTESPTNFFLPTHPLGAGDYRAVFTSDDVSFGGNGNISEDYVYTAKDVPGHGVGFEVYIPSRTAVAFKHV